jgi:hypothetical protein
VKHILAQDEAGRKRDIAREKRRQSGAADAAVKAADAAAQHRQSNTTYGVIFCYGAYRKIW